MGDMNALVWLPVQRSSFLLYLLLPPHFDNTWFLLVEDFILYISQRRSVSDYGEKKC